MQSRQSLNVIIGKGFWFVSHKVPFADLTGDRRVINLSMGSADSSVKKIHGADLVNAKGSFLGVDCLGVVAAFDCCHCTEQVFLRAVVSAGRTKGDKGDKQERQSDFVHGRENIRFAKTVKLFFRFIVFSFGVPRGGNYGKFRACFMRVKNQEKSNKTLDKNPCRGLSPRTMSAKLKRDGVSKGPTITTRYRFSLYTMPSLAVTSPLKEAKSV